MPIVREGTKDRYLKKTDNLIDPNFKWFKITFTSAAESTAMQLAAAACQRTDQARDFVIYLGREFSDDGKIGYTVLYFSPNAAFVCEDLTLPFNDSFSACAPPNRDDDMLSRLCGNTA